MRIPYRIILLLFLGTSQVAASWWWSPSEDSEDEINSSDDDYSDLDDDIPHPTHELFPKILGYAWQGAYNLAEAFLNPKTEQVQVPTATLVEPEPKERIEVSAEDVKVVEDAVEISPQDMVYEPLLKDGTTATSETESDNSFEALLKPKKIEHDSLEQNIARLNNQHKGTVNPKLLLGKMRSMPRRPANMNNLRVVKEGSSNELGIEDEIVENDKIYEVAENNPNVVYSPKLNSSFLAKLKAAESSLKQANAQRELAKERASSRSIVSEFLTKVSTSVDYEAERKKLRPIPVATSPNYQGILKLLHESYMGDFDFSNIEAEEEFEYNNVQDGNLIPGYPGLLWLQKKWADLKDTNVTALQEIKKTLNKVAPTAMSKLPSLAPKKTYEKEVLEGWLVQGLLAAYPTLTAGVSKNDAIALVLLAVLSKSFTNPENHQAINNLMQELRKYNGNLPGNFPLDQFNFGAQQDAETTQPELMVKIFTIIDDKGLAYAAEVVAEILDK